MKHFNVKLTTLKSKLYAIVFASFVVRVVAFFALPNTPSSLGPDEGTYARAANWTALGKSATDFPDFGAGLYVSGRSLLLPAAFFNNLGFNQLNSVRLTASLYGFMTICVATVVILKTASKNEWFAQFIKTCPKIFLSLFLTFTFLPSHFLWSSLGLRESSTEFWTLSLFASLFLLLQANERIPLLLTCGFLVSIVMVFSARPQVGWVLSLSVILSLFSKIKHRVARILILITILGVTLGYITTFDTSYTLKRTFSALDVTTDTSGEFDANKKCSLDGEKIQINGTEYACILKIEKVFSKHLKNPVLVLVDQVDSIPYHHEVNKLDAESIIQTQFCPFAGVSQFNGYICLAYRAPYTTFTFLFRPLYGIDATSAHVLFAATENILWLAAVLYVIIMFIRNRRLAFFSSLVPSLVFFLIYSVFAGAYEGNMGTAFRHKSLILWVVLLLIASTIVATQQRKAEQGGISGSSKE